MPTDTDQHTNRRVVRHLSVLYFSKAEDHVTGLPTRSVQSATRGQEIDLIPSEEERLESLGALLPKGADPGDAELERQALIDAYRGQRGDQEAASRAAARAGGRLNDGGVVNVEADVDGKTVGQLAEWLRDEKPNVEDTVALAEGDPAKAEKILAAEREATGNNPRSGVEQRLSKIAEG